MTDENEYLATLVEVATNEATSFVVFRGGTVVAFVEPDASVDLAIAAQALMKEYGPVHPGSPAGDFGVTRLRQGYGWAVTSHHPDIFTLVLPSESPRTRATPSSVSWAVPRETRTRATSRSRRLPTDADETKPSSLVVASRPAFTPPTHRPARRRATSAVIARTAPEGIRVSVGCAWP